MQTDGPTNNQTDRQTCMLITIPYTPTGREMTSEFLTRKINYYTLYK